MHVICYFYCKVLNIAKTYIHNIDNYFARPTSGQWCRRFGFFTEPRIYQGVSVYQ